MAGRVSGELIGVHVAVDDGLAQHDDTTLAAQRMLVTQLGGTVHEVVGHDTAETMAAFARREKATQLVLGASRRSRWHELVHGSFVARVTRLAGDIDVHVIAQPDAPAPSKDSTRRPPLPNSDRRRAIAAWILTVLGLPLFIAATLPLRPTIDLSTELLLALVFVLVIAVVGGRLVGAVAAIVASLFLNWFFVEPYNTLTIAEAENVISLVVFITVAVGVGALVDTVSRRSLEANRARLEAEALARSTTSLAADPEPIPRLVEHLRSTFDLDGVLLTRADSNGRVAARGGRRHPLAGVGNAETVLGTQRWARGRIDSRGLRPFTLR